VDDLERAGKSSDETDADSEGVSNFTRGVTRIVQQGEVRGGFDGERRPGPVSPIRHV
jgi:hypothetical protein